MRNALPRRPLVAGSAAALVLLAGGATATAVNTPAEDPDRTMAMRFEAHPAHAARTEAPGMTVPDDAEWSMPTPDAKAEAPTPDPREVAAASRAAQRQELAQQEAARQAAQEEAAEREAAQQQTQESQQQGAGQQGAAEAQQQEARQQRQEPQTTSAVADGSERGTLTAMLNNYRTSNGLSPLSRDGGLDQAAQQWAQWMASNQSLQHSGYVNGSKQRAAGWSAGSEIIVRYRGGGSLPSGEITSFMHNWWRGSAVHNANMLKSEFTHVGTGYAMGPGGPYAVHIFGG